MLKYLCGVDNPTLGEFLYMLGSMYCLWRMEDSTMIDTAMLSIDHIRNIGKGNVKTRCKALYSSTGFGDCELNKPDPPIKLNIMDVLLSLWKYFLITKRLSGVCYGTY